MPVMFKCSACGGEHTSKTLQTGNKQSFESMRRSGNNYSETCPTKKVTVKYVDSDLVWRRHSANKDLSQRWEEAKKLSVGNPTTSAPNEVHGQAKAHVEELSGLVRQAEQEAQQPTGKIANPKDEVLKRKEALADAIDLEREIGEWLKTRQSA